MAVSSSGLLAPSWLPTWPCCMIFLVCDEPFSTMELTMKLKTLALAISTALGATLAAGAAHAAGNEGVIGDIDDLSSLHADGSRQAAGKEVVTGDSAALSSLYADVIGQGGIEAAKMAIADFGGSVLGKKI